MPWLVQEVDGVGVDPRVGHEHVDLLERGEAEHLDVAELGLVDQGHDARARSIIARLIVCSSR